MSIRLIWKGFMFTLSILMLLLVMGYGKTPSAAVPSNTSIISGQAKVAKPGARTTGFKAVKPAAAPVVEKTIWDQVRDTTEAWMGGGNMNSAGGAKRSELQNLQRRAKGQGTATTMSVQKMSR